MLPLLIATALAGDCSLQKGVYLLTMAPGNDVQTVFGHTALLVYDPKQGGYSPVYDYGRFTVDPLPQMASEVLRMVKPYFMGSRSLDKTIERYDYLGRGITAQRLGLTNFEADALVLKLLGDMEGDSSFPYNWYRPNCTTMVQEGLDDALGGAIKAQLSAKEGTSPAAEVLRHSGGLLPLWFGLEWGSGRFAHTPVSQWDSAFLPDGLRAHVATVKLSSQRPLVVDTCVLGDVTPAVVPAEIPNRHLLLWGLGLVWAVAVAGVSMARRGAGLAVVGAQGLAVGLFGAAAVLVGYLGTFAPFWGHHNLMLANPGHLALVGAAVWSHRNPSARGPMLIAGALGALMGLGFLWSLTGWLADHNLGLVGLTLLPVLAAAWALRPRP